MRIDRIRERLADRLAPASLELVDEGHLHAGHAGARSGKGHFRVRIVSDAFTGRGTVQRHRMVYDALGEIMTQEIHALSIEALTPAEVSGPR